MSARDRFEDCVKSALQEDGWFNIAPLALRYGQTKLEIDLGAERFLSAQRGSIQIVVEVKSFASASVVYEFHQAIGQYLNYRMVLRRLEPQRILYLALPTEIYDITFRTEFFQDSLNENKINLILVEAQLERISQWQPIPKAI